MDVFLKYPAAHFSHLALPVAAPYPGGHVMAQNPEQPVPLSDARNSVKGSVHTSWLALQLKVEFPALSSDKKLWRRLRPRSLRPAWLPASSMAVSSLRPAWLPASSMALSSLRLPVDPNVYARPPWKNADELVLMRVTVASP